LCAELYTGSDANKLWRKRSSYFGNLTYSLITLRIRPKTAQFYA